LWHKCDARKIAELYCISSNGLAEYIWTTLAEQQAKDQAFDKLSLIVFEQNTGAKKLYETMGYQEVARETIYPHPLIRYTGNALLVLKML
jgi:ribosomal protein S18 acetylase RimI-like enzyme